MKKRGLLVIIAGLLGALALLGINSPAQAASDYETIPGIITVPGPGGGPHLRAFETDRNALSSPNTMVYADTSRMGARVDVGDLNGDGKDEIITSPRRGGGPQVRVFNQDGSIYSNGFFAYDEDFHGGLDVALGDLNGDGRDEIVVGAGEGGGPHVRVFDSSGHPTINAGFFAYAPTFRGGVRVACGDVDKDGKDEIITGAGPGGGPHIRVFDENGQPKPIDFMAFHADNRSGVDVASADVDKDGQDEIGTCQLSEQAWCKVYRYNDQRSIIGEFRAFGEAPVGSNLTMGDFDGDQRAELITGANVLGGPQVLGFEADGRPLWVNFFAYDEFFRGGVDVAISSFKVRKDRQKPISDPSDSLYLFFMHHSTGQIYWDGGLESKLKAHNYKGYAPWWPGGTDPGDFYSEFKNADNWYVMTRENMPAGRERDIILFKSCFPASDIDSAAELEQYKTWYRQLFEIYAAHPHKLFVPMSTPPLLQVNSNVGNAARAGQFEDWLMSNYIPEYRAYLTAHGRPDYKNLAPFRLHSLLSDNQGFLAPSFQSSPTDDHPNAYSGQVVGEAIWKHLNSAATNMGLKK